MSMSTRSSTSRPLAFSLYRLATRALRPLLPWYLRRRANAGKEIPERIQERFGNSTTPRPQGTLLWFHAASVGELNSILPLIHALTAHKPTLHILVTTVTVTSATIAVQRLPERALHQFAPIDTPDAISAFLNHWQPHAACFIDSEFWPNMLTMTHDMGCPMIVLNARISARSFARWQKHPTIIRALLACFTTLYAKSPEDAQRLRALGAPHVLEKGNLKFSTPDLPCDEKQMDALRSMIGNRAVWLAASTHDGEEQLIADAHQQLITQFPDLLTIIVPRHAVRGADIAQQLSATLPHIALRSRDDTISPNTECYVADTMGELGLFYRLCPVAFIGGSLVPHGGQNPFEAARLGCAIVYGPHMHNFNEFCDILASHQSAITITNADTLASAVAHLLSNPEERSAMAQRARNAVLANHGALEAITADMLAMLNNMEAA